MNILAIDSATEACSAALWMEGKMLSRFENAPRQHTELLLPMVDSLLKEASLGLGDMDALAFGRGPGSFTGVRIASACVQGLAWAAKLPVVPVSTLAAMARATIEKQRADYVACAIDARMGEVYWACYQRDAMGYPSLISDEKVIPPGDVSAPLNTQWHAAGTGWAAYGDLLSQQFAGNLVTINDSCLPNAREIAILAVEEFNRGHTVRADQALPVYLRNKVAHQIHRTVT